jgi:hypothetical protein
MDSFNYFQLVYNNLPSFGIISVIIYTIYFIIFKKYYLSIIDPFTITFFFSANAIIVPFFLFYLNEISINHFIIFIITQVAFIIGFITISPITISKLNLSDIHTSSFQNLKFSKWFFIIVSLIATITQLIAYKLFDIPLFAKSRLLVYGESGGWGQLLYRILNITYPCSIFFTLFFILNKKGKISFYAKLNAVLLVIFTLLKGSKSAFLSFGLCFFIYALYSVRWGDKLFFDKINKYSIKFLIIVLITAVIIIFLSENTTNPIRFLFARIGMSGDVYYMAYPNSVIDIIPKSNNWFINLFSSPLSLMGIIDHSQIPKPMGFFLMEYHTSGAIIGKGPNARMNVFSYVYLGNFFAPIYCFIIGLILSFIRNKLFFLLPKNITGCLLYYLFLSTALKFEADFHNALADFINITVILVPIMLFAYYLSLPNAKHTK